MAREVSGTITNFDQSTGRVTMQFDDGNPFASTAAGGMPTQALVPTTGQPMVPVRLPSGAMVQMSAADAQVLQAEYRAMQARVQQQQVVDLSGGGGGNTPGGFQTMGTFAEAGLAVGEFFKGREGKRLVGKAVSARKDMVAAQNKMTNAVDAVNSTIDAVAFKQGMEEFFKANEKVNRYQDEIALTAANWAYWRAAGGGVKTVERIQAGGGLGSIFGGGGVGGGNFATGAMAGAFGGFMLSELLSSNETVTLIDDE